MVKECNVPRYSYRNSLFWVVYRRDCCRRIAFNLRTCCLLSAVGLKVNKLETR